MYALNITSIGLSWIMLLVAMSPGLADQAGGNDLTPEVVDVFGYPRDFRIEGAVGIQPKEIRNALIRSPRFIMASHPAADFEKLLEVTKSDLIRGYQKSGFASPEVDVSWDGTTREVVVRVVEGPRYRLNKVRITGNSKVSRDAIKRRLAPMDDDADESSLRSDMAMESIMEEKEISEKVIAEAWNKAFPAHSQKDRLASGILSILNNPGFREKMAVWEKGKWVNFQPHYLETAELLARSVYADAGLFGPKFEIGIVPEESAEGVADLVIKVISEGRPAKIGRIHVSGNRVNSREGILKFLGFEEGVVLQGPWLKRSSRKLFDSGRFLGWRVVPKASVSDPGSIDLLIVVEEEWEAPPLDAPLSPEQQALLKMADWVNTKFGVEGDLVIKLGFGSGDEAVELSAAMNREEIALAYRDPDHRLATVIPRSGILALLAESHANSFFSFFPLKNGNFELRFNIINSPREDPYEKSGEVGFGLGIGSASTTEATALKLLIDPAMTMMMHRGSEVALPRVVDEKLILLINRTELRFDASTGRFLSLRNLDENSGFTLTGSIETGAVNRMRARLNQDSEGLENWNEGRAGSALIYQGAFFAMEVIRVLESGDPNLTFAEMTRQAAGQARRWDSMVTFLGEVTSSVIGGKDPEEDQNPLEDEFEIPSPTTRETGYARGGQFTGYAIEFGLFDGLMKYVEPGSWPDRVMREIIFIMDGDTNYFNITLPILLKDESMGPMGCLICAKLLQLLEQPSAEAFVRKAEGELNVAGFEKDWRILLSGTAGEGALGWELLKAFQHVKEEDLYEVFAEEKSAMIAPLVDLARRAGTVKPDTKAGELRSIIDVLWEYGVGDLMKEAVHKEKNRILKNRWDPEAVAAVVNGRTVPRGAIRYARQVDGEGINQNGLLPVEQEITNLLAALDTDNRGEIRKSGKFDKHFRALFERLGGKKGVDGFGFTEKQAGRWLGISALATLKYEQLPGSGEITPEEVREFYEKDPFLQGLVETNVHTIECPLIGRGDDQRRLIKQIRNRILKAGPDLKAMRQAFEKEATEHSGDDFKFLGGRRGWVVDGSLGQRMSASLAKVKDGSLSQVFEHVNDGKRAVLLILVSEPRRKADFDSVKEIALFRAYRERLLVDAKIDVIEDPSLAQEEETFSPLKSLLKTIAPDFASRMMAKSKEKEKETNHLANLPPQNQVLIRARMGKKADLYLLGTYAERGVSPSTNGLEEALELYRKAAEKGHDDAMGRLSELYRLGRGIERDKAKAKEWRKKAAAAFMKN